MIWRAKIEIPRLMFIHFVHFYNVCIFRCQTTNSPIRAWNIYESSPFSRKKFLSLCSIVKTTEWNGLIIIFWYWLTSNYFIQNWNQYWLWGNFFFLPLNYICFLIGKCIYNFRWIYIYIYNFYLSKEEMDINTITGFYTLV
jgi:hypothetical protein